MTAFKKKTSKDGEGEALETKRDGTWEFAPFLWVLLPRRANKGAALSLSWSRFSIIIYRSWENFWLVVVRIKDLLLPWFLGEVSPFFYGPAESWKMGSWGSVLGESRGCRRLIEAEAGPPELSRVECVDWKRRGDNSNASAKIERVVPFKVEFF